MPRISWPCELFRTEVRTSRDLRSIDVLKSEWQRLVTKELRPRLKLVMQVWSECVARIPQLSNHLACGDARTWPVRNRCPRRPSTNQSTSDSVDGPSASDADCKSTTCGLDGGRLGGTGTSKRHGS